MSAPRLLVTLSEADLRALVREELAAALVPEQQSSAAPPAAVDREGLARELGCSIKMIDRLRKRPNFPEFALGDSPRFVVAEVIAWIRAKGPLRLVSAK